MKSLLILPTVNSGKDSVYHVRRRQAMVFLVDEPHLNKQEAKALKNLPDSQRLSDRKKRMLRVGN